jgi:hypothetical protein
MSKVSHATVVYIIAPIVHGETLMLQDLHCLLAPLSRYSLNTLVYSANRNMASADDGGPRLLMLWTGRP